MALTSDRKRVVRNGAPTTDLVLSACMEGNEIVFPEILELYVKPGSVIADVTYGKGVFWRNVRVDKYDLRATDIQNGIDCRDLPYVDQAIDCVVLDPPICTHRAEQRINRIRRSNRITETTDRAIRPTAGTMRPCLISTVTPGGKHIESCANGGSSSSSARMKYVRIGNASPMWKL